MKKLPQVFLVLTVLGLGVMYGSYRFKLDRGEAVGGFATFVRNTLKDMGNRLAGKKGDTPGDNIKFADNSSGSTHSSDGWEYQPDEQDKEEPPEEETTSPDQLEPREEQESNETLARETGEVSYKDRLDEIDLLMKEASIYLNVATINVELRGEYAKKAFDGTSKALGLFGLFSEETQNRQEFQQRLKTITEVRHAAMKLAPIEK